MSEAPLGALGVTFAGVSLVAIGGANAVVPEIHRQVVERGGWLSSAEFAALFAIAQAAPGPNVLIASLIGWRLHGFSGLLVATLAMSGPSSLLALAAGRLSGGFARARLVGLLRAGLVPVAVGLILASGAVLARAAADGPVPFAVTALAAAVLTASRLNPLLVLIAGALAGLVAAG